MQYQKEKKLEKGHFIYKLGTRISESSKNDFFHSFFLEMKNFEFFPSIDIPSCLTGSVNFFTNSYKNWIWVCLLNNQSSDSFLIKP